MENTILFEDNHLIAVVKRPGDISQGDKTGDVALSDIVKDYLKIKYNKPGNVYVGLIHRLDRPVSGVMLFAKTSKAAARMHAVLLKKQLQKTYWAVIKQLPPEKEATIENYMVKNEKLNKSFIVDANKPGAKNAVLHYTLIASSDNYHLLEVDLETGRHHQIRAQLAHMGCPIKGDLKYGFPRSNTDGSIHLHAYRVRFPHPITQETIVLHSIPGNDPVWNAFAAMHNSR